MSQLGTPMIICQVQLLRVNGSLMPQTEIDVEIIKNNMRTASMSQDEYFDSFNSLNQCSGAGHLRLTSWRELASRVMASVMLREVPGTYG